MNRMKDTVEEKNEKKAPLETFTFAATDMNTTYREDFVHYDKVKRRERIKPAGSSDQELISGYFTNNLQVNGKLLKTKTWPNMMPHTEEYQHFLKRFECCWKDIYKMYFACPPVAQDIIDNMLANLPKTVYQMSYSPDTFQSSKELRRCINRNKIPNTVKFEETTYRFFHNQILQLERFRDLLHSVCKTPDDNEELKAQLKKIYRCGRSTYHDTYTVPAKIIAKTTPTGPLDRYSLRRV